MFGTAKFGEIFLKLDYIGPKTKGAIIQSAGNGGIDFLANSTHLGGQIEVRNGQGFFNNCCHLQFENKQLLFLSKAANFGVWDRN